MVGRSFDKEVSMKTFSEKTLELAINLVLDIQGKNFPLESLDLGLIVSTSEWEIVKEMAVDGGQESKAIDSILCTNKEKLASIGVFDDATAIAFIEKRRSQLEKWEEKHDAFKEKVELELKKLQDSFRLDLKELQDKFLDWNN
jgi:hypothetical protein